MDTGLGAKAYAIIEQGKIGMILSSRPTDQRQLIEEAAGITKYKARRRSAELKLEAAQPNLTRIDDIVFEVEKQRGSLKRQAAKARRYQRLRDELRRWEKVLFARRYRDLDAGRSRRHASAWPTRASARRLRPLAWPRQRTRSSAVRIESRDADAAATAAARAARTPRSSTSAATEQQVELNRQQIGVLGVRIEELRQEIDALDARREPQQAELTERRVAAADADGATSARSPDAFGGTGVVPDCRPRHRGLETDVETARRDVFGAMSQASALATPSTTPQAARERVQRVAVASRRRGERPAGRERAPRRRPLRRRRRAVRRRRRIWKPRAPRRAALEAELAAARATQNTLGHALRSHEHELAGTSQPASHRSRNSRPRAPVSRRLPASCWPRPTAPSSSMARWPTGSRSTAAMSAPSKRCPATCCNTSIVPPTRTRPPGCSCCATQEAGRCGFLVVGDGVSSARAAGGDGRGADDGVGGRRATGPFADTVSALLPRGYVADVVRCGHRDRARNGRSVATLDGELVRGAHLVVGGARGEGRGILATKNEIKELRGRIDVAREQVGDG